MAKYVRVNERIRAREVRLVDSEGKQLGIMSSRKALEVAKERGLDLVEVAPDAQPPVCKLMDYGKFKYDEKKRKQKAMKAQKVAEVKAIRFSPSTGEHDFRFKVNNIIKFLKEGRKVKVNVRFRSREMTHPDISQSLMERIAKEVSELGKVEEAPRVESRTMTMTIAPKK